MVSKTFSSIILVISHSITMEYLNPLIDNQTQRATENCREKITLNVALIALNITYQPIYLHREATFFAIYSSCVRKVEVINTKQEL